MNDKIYGLYSSVTEYEENILNNLPEEDVWMKIHNLSYKLINAKREYELTYDVSIEKIKLHRYLLEYLIYSTRRFGVTFDEEPTIDKHIKLSDSYRKWYSFWENHFNSLTKEEFNSYLKFKSRDLNVNALLPRTKWNDEEKKLTK